MKNLHKWLLAFLPVSFLLTFPGNTPVSQAVTSHSPSCETDNQAFLDGEEVTYKLYYQLNFIWISAGEVKFKVRENKNTYIITADGRTASAFEWFYKVEDHYKTVIDKKTLLPIEFVRDIHEGKFELYNKFTFDQINKKVTSYKGRDKDHLKIKQYDISGCMHDMMSIIYSTRNVNLDSFEKDDTFPVNVFLEDEYNLDVKLVEKNLVKRIKGLGKFRTHAISPELIAGDVFNAGTKMTVWVTADDNRVPLMIESPVSVGSVKAVLQDFRGLRHPFSSKFFD